MENEERKIKILYIDGTETFGGAPIILANTIKYLDKNKYSPFVICSQTKEFIKDNFKNIKVLKVPALKFHKSYLENLQKKIGKFIFYIHFLYHFIFKTCPRAIKIYRFGKKNKIDLIHLNNEFSIEGILCAKLLGVPCIITHRRFEDTNSKILHILTNFVTKDITISKAVADNLSLIEKRKNKIEVLNDFTEIKKTDNDFIKNLVSKIKKQDSTKIISIFGRIVQWKGQKEFIVAMSQVIKEMPDCIGLIVGDISDGGKKYLNEIKELVKKLHIEDKIIFTGYTKNVAEYMATSDIVVHASIEPEPFGLVVIEAMAMKKPVIATKGGGPLDVITDGKNGLLVEMGN
jgi:glycosyltransferase involved in cell wall biosynthesis